MSRNVADNQISFIDDLGDAGRARLTPMMRQYMEIKDEYRDCILLFRIGDFYEMFFDDALTASAALEITLTKKNCGIDGERAPLCGVPYHSCEPYIARLLEQGYKVAICDQMEDPATAKGLVKREVTRIITPGTVTGDLMLEAAENNYLVSVYAGKAGTGLAWTDISTGEVRTAELGDAGRETVLNELSRIGAAEILIYEDGDLAQAIAGAFEVPVFPLAAADVAADAGLRRMAGLQGYENLRALGLMEDGAALPALFGLFSYLEKTQKQQLGYLKPPAAVRLTDHMLLDKASIRSLELTETLLDGSREGSLLGVLDRTRTAMGGRLLKKWIKEPLTDAGRIRARHDAVETLYEDVLLRNDIGAALGEIYDLERLIGRVSYGNANGRDLIALMTSLQALPDIQAALSDAEAGTLLAEICAGIEDHGEAAARIAAAIVEEPPFTVREGGLIRPGYSEELDALKASIADGQAWISELEGLERARTGIKNLKVRFNKVFGYYIDVTNSWRDRVPADYIRKQTLVNSERYITEELKEVESRVLNAEAHINRLEYELFDALRVSLLEEVPSLQRTAGALAALDVLVSFAHTAEKQGYAKPEVDDGEVIRIRKGRHPVIENNLKDKAFVPNDVFMDRGRQSMLLITGPNMAGKSTYMRMTALIVLLAQIGSFVPADEAQIGIADRLYTRIGASDNLAKGESTFFVEMNELAYILNTATRRSLIVLDEIGRGTSTYDGLSIAWAVLEFLCREGQQVRTLFATHYHELTALEGEMPGMVNMNTEIAEVDGEILFLHRIAAGSAERSYGIHVAKLAGVPEAVLGSAQRKLDALEAERMRADAGRLGQLEFLEAQETGAAAAAGGAGAGASADIGKEKERFEAVRERLAGVNLMEMTPAKAFEVLEELKELLR